MEQTNDPKNSNQNNEKTREKYHYGNLSLYQYKDPSGKTNQVTRPAFIKISND
jgi:hypothetical protein